MEIDNKRDNNWPVTITIVFTLFILFVGIFIDIVANDTSKNSIAAFLMRFLNNSFLLILLIQAVLMPVAVYLFNRHQKTLTSTIVEKLKIQDHLKFEVTKYINHLINGNYTDDLNELTENDPIKLSLINLRDTLKTNKELVDKQRKEDIERNWNAEGLAKFGEILRNNQNLEDLSFNIIKELVKYIGAIQGGFFHLEEDKGQKYLKLVAFYAYGRKKYADKKVPWDKGLIGTAAKEQKTVQMDKLPDGYVLVTSGLGQANPNQIIVVPMVSEGVLFGVLEIASLNKITPKHVSFVEKVAENTASTLSTVRMNMRTSILLEESNEQAQALAAQEEEMRQNMEELKATQEEAARQAEKFLRLENTVNHTMIRAEYNMKGILLYANTNFLKKLEYTSNSQVEGKHISMFVSKKDEDWFNNIWDNLSKGGRHFEGYMKHVTRSGKDLWTLATYTCIRDDGGDAERILFLALDTTEQKKLSLNLEGLMDAVNRSSLKIEFETNGNIKNHSDSFMYLFKYNAEETAALNVTDLIDPLELENFNKKWENIVNGMNFEGQFKVRTKTNKEAYMQGAFCAVYNMYGEVDKVIYIGHDISKQKLMEIEFKDQNETLKKQEKQLRESEKQLSSKLREAKLEMQEQFKQIEHIKIRNERTLEGALDAILQTSQNNTILFFNRAAENLLGYSREEIIDKDIKTLFSKETIENNDFVKRYLSPDDNKIVGVRTEIKMKPKDGDELSVLILLSKAQVDNETTYTAFIQTIEVELF